MKYGEHDHDADSGAKIWPSTWFALGIIRMLAVPAAQLPDAGVPVHAALAEGGVSPQLYVVLQDLY
jgi:hypothetical protein